MDKSPENFRLNEDTKLYLPVGAEVNQPWTSRPSHQEIAGQREVFGVDGHGSIRNETNDFGSHNNEQLEDSIKNMLDPKNIIDLKEQLENSVSRQIEESTHPVDKRLDKDGQSRKDKIELHSTIKASLVDQYTQIGTDVDSPREVPESVAEDISRMLDMSFEELESKIVSEKVNDTYDEKGTLTPPAPDKTPASKPGAPFSAPDIKTRSFNQKEFDEANDNLQKAIKNGDEELFKKSVAFLRNEEVAKGLITGSSNLDGFNKFVLAKRTELENRNNTGNKSDDDKKAKPTPKDTSAADISSSDDKQTPPPPPLYTNIGGATNGNDGDDSDKGTPLPPPLPLPVPLDSKPTKEKKSVGKRVLAGVLVGAAVIGSLVVAKNALDDDSSVENLDKTEETTETTDNSSGETTPLNDSALDKLDAFETQPETNGDEQEEASSEEELAELKQAIKERTVEIADTQSEFGNTTWDKATVLYGALATPMLIEAAEAVAADGIEVEWTADPNTSTEADLFINGTNDPSVVWQFLAPRLAKEDVTNFLENIETNSSGDEVLPETE